jgi:ribosomal protein S25
MRIFITFFQHVLETCFLGTSDLASHKKIFRACRVDGKKRRRLLHNGLILGRIIQRIFIGKITISRLVKMPETKQIKLKIMYGKSRQINIIKRDLFIAKEVQDNMEKAIPKMKYVTPSELSQKFGVRVTAARALLKEMEKKHLVKRSEQVQSPKIQVYVPIPQAKAK